MAIRSGDVILHKPSGETWVVAAVSPNGKELVCCGWPETIANVSDCKITKPATDEEHIAKLATVISSCRGELRGSWAGQELEATERKPAQ